MSGFYLIASYPKSGNTWVRMAIECMMNPLKDIDINGLNINVPIGQSWLEHHLGVDPLELLPEEIIPLRADVFRDAAAVLKSPAFLKVHDAFLPPLHSCEAPYPKSAIEGVIYLVRDPRDVAVSYAFHSGQSVEQIVDDMCSSTKYIAWPCSPRTRHVAQFLSSWSGHVRSWVFDAGLRTLVKRYEDIVGRPEAVFGSIVEFAKLNVDAAGIRNAVAATRFERLQAVESSRGFAERYHSSTAPFFRSGRPGGWKSELPRELAARIVNEHSAVMQEFGYEV